MIYLIQEMVSQPFQTGMLIYLSFQIVGKFSCITLRTEEEELIMLKHYSH